MSQRSRKRRCLVWEETPLRPSNPNLPSLSIGMDKSNPRVPVIQRDQRLPSQQVAVEARADKTPTKAFPKKRLTYREWLAEQKVPETPLLPPHIPPAPPSTASPPGPPPIKRMSYREWLAEQQRAGLKEDLRTEKTSDEVVNERLGRANQRKSFPAAVKAKRPAEEDVTATEAKEAEAAAPIKPDPDLIELDFLTPESSPRDGGVRMAPPNDTGPFSSPPAPARPDSPPWSRGPFSWHDPDNPYRVPQPAIRGPYNYIYDEASGTYVQGEVRNALLFFQKHA